MKRMFIYKIDFRISPIPANAYPLTGHLFLLNSIIETRETVTYQSTKWLSGG